MKDEFINEVLQAHKKSFQRAFETAVRTGTALVYARGEKIVEIKPPYRYELVEIKQIKKKKSVKRKKK